MVLVLWVMFGHQCGDVFAQQPHITDVIKVCEFSARPFGRAVKWSPDGSRIAFFKDGSLCTADTLGRLLEIKKLDLNIREFEWLDTQRICLAQSLEEKGAVSQFRVSVVDLNGVETLLESAKLERPKRPSFGGPIRTPAGHVYYRPDQSLRNGVVVLSSPGKSQPASPGEIFELRLVNDTLYKRAIDGSSPLVLTTGKMSSPVASPDFTKVVYKNYPGDALILNIATGQTTTIEKPELPVPEKATHSGIIDYKFHQRNDLVTYSVTFEDGHEVYGNTVCVYDSRRNLSWPLTEIAHYGDARSLTISPDGDLVTFLAGDRGLYMARLGGM